MSLKDRIRQEILLTGPMALSRYMSLCLSDPDDGYYTTRKVFGRTGDFITAPEVSQMFGELIGAFTDEAFRRCGSPVNARLMEIGPGRGTLMKDVLRVLNFSGSLDQFAEVALVESSPNLEAVQRQTLEKIKETVKPPLKWYTSIQNDWSNPLFLFANELIDALPVDQFLYRSGTWAKRAVGLSAGDELEWGLIPAAAPVLPADLLADLKDGAVYEDCPAASDLITGTCLHLIRHGGVALFIDYGHTRSGFGDTFQAVRDHRRADPLADPGKADLTAHVDFDAIARIARANGAFVHGPVTQGAFLLSLGLLERAGQLGAALDEAGRNKIRDDVERLAAPDQMGDLFKVIAISATKMDLPGF